MIMSDLAAMAVFARDVEEESFSAAARLLGLSKSAVSKQVARLEDRLGVRLLHRTTRRLSLTEEGATFFRGCQRALAEAEAAESAVTHLAAAPRGTLKVNAPMSFGVAHLSPLIPAFMARFPDLKVELELNDRLVDLVEEGFDVGVRITRLQDSSLIARRLAPSRNVICAAPDYLRARGSPEAPEALAGHDCLLYSYTTEGRVWRLRSAAGRRQVTVRGRLLANNGEALRDAALQGLGVARLPTFIVGDALRQGHLLRLLTDWSDERESGVYAVYPASRNLAPKVRVFVDFLVERFGDPPYWEQGI